MPRKRTRKPGVEWVGGTLPTSLRDRQDPSSTDSPAWTVWFQPSGNKILTQLLHPASETEGTLARLLRQALESPEHLAARRPDRVRIADAELVREIERVLGGGVPVEVGPTPELDEVRDLMVQLFDKQEDDAGYLDEYDLDPADVRELFEAAIDLRQDEPWSIVAEDQPIRFDAPALGVQGAWVLLGSSERYGDGLVIFRSERGFASFVEAADRLDDECLQLTLQLPEDVSMRRLHEAVEQGWPFDPEVDLYPLAHRLGRNGVPIPLRRQDLRILAACATTIGTFVRRSAWAFDRAADEPVSAPVGTPSKLEVRFTYPADVAVAPASATVPAAPVHTFPKVGRNDPCPCGSGRKYKKCHMQADQANRELADNARDRDAQLTFAVIDHARKRTPAAVERALDRFAQGDAMLSFAASHVAYDLFFDGETAASRFLREQGGRLAGEDRAWIEARAAAWPSVWEVLRADPGRGLQLRDLLTQETRYVTEASASRMLVVHDTILSHVVEHRGEAFLCGTHPRLLPPATGRDLVRRARGRLRRPKGPVPIERLQEDGFAAYLAGRWEASVRRLERASPLPEKLVNSSGDPFVLAVDRYDHDSADEVERRLSAAMELSGGDPTDEGRVFAVLDPGPRAAAEERPILAYLVLTDRKLRVDTTSVERADAMRARIEQACGDLVRHRIRDLTDPLSPRVLAGARARARAERDPGPPRQSDPAIAEAVRDHRHRHYALWIDESIPALGGRTPRQAVRSAEGRAAVDALLRDMENMEARSSPGTAFDFGVVRRELGLEPH